jgi:hypothetical protein
MKTPGMWKCRRLGKRGRAWERDDYIKNRRVFQVYPAGIFEKFFDFILFSSGVIHFASQAVRSPQILFLLGIKPEE